MREARLYFQDILQACDYILEFTARQSFDEFRSDAKTRSAVERQFEIIGEASRQLPGEYRDRYAQIPWRQISGMRNIIAHAYFGIDQQAVWDAIDHDVRRLRADVHSILDAWTESK